jgi:hypothetical protein
MSNGEKAVVAAVAAFAIATILLALLLPIAE